MRWLEILFAYYRDNHAKSFEEAMERALHKFFPESHEPVPFRGEERDQADGRFWDFFIFEYRDKVLKKKTLIEYMIDEDPELSEIDRNYFKLLLESQLYSIFRVTKVHKGEAVELQDLISGGKYEVKEFLRSLQFEVDYLVFWRIFKDDCGNYRFAPGNPTVWGLEAVIGLGNTIEQQNFNKEEVTALTIEQTFLNKKDDSEKPNDTSETPNERMRKFLIAHNSTFTLESLIEAISNDKLGSFRFSKLLSSFRKAMSEKASYELMEIWNEFANNIPRKSLDEKSPQQMVQKENIGPKEKGFITELSRALDQKIDHIAFPTLKAANYIAEKFQKDWLDFPQERLDGKTPKEVILEERKSMENFDLEVDPFFSLSQINESSEIVLLDKIDTKDVEILHDMELFLDFIDTQKTVKLTKEGLLKKHAYEKLIPECKRKAMYGFHCGKKIKWFMATWSIYLDFVQSLAEMAGLVDRNKNVLTINGERVREFKTMSSGEKLKFLFCTYFFGDDWSLLIGRNNKIKDWIDDHMFHRESTLINLEETKGRKIKFEDFFMQFYASKKAFLEKKENSDIKQTQQVFLMHLTIQPFQLFGLIKCFTKRKGYYLTSLEDLLALDSVQVTKIALQLLPHLYEEMYLRNLDQCSLRGDFLPDSDRNESQTSSSTQKIGRNEPCPCNSEKKFKKCCGK